MSRHVTTMTIWDAEHYTEEQRDAIIGSYKEYERDARVKGIPALGSGRVYPIAEEPITVQPFDIPSTFHKIGGLDFGGSGDDGHPTAAVKLAHDRDADIIYVTHAYSRKGGTTLHHAAAVKPWHCPIWAWPHDGLKKMEVGNSSVAIKDMYANHGLKMHPERAQFEDGGFGVEGGINEILEYMETGRFKVFAHLEAWFIEFRQYHRKDGIIVKEYDDILDATRYAFMMRRFAERDTKTKWGKPNRQGII